MLRYKNIKLLVLLTMLFSGSVSAQTESSAPLFNFKFDHVSNIKNTEQSLVTNNNDFVFNVLPATNENSLQFSQYDATLIYPWEAKNINFDLGITVRLLSGTTNSEKDNLYFQKTLPLLHGAALFNFPLKGLSAGIEGNHLDLSDTQIFDYRAKLSYEWRSGLGMQGGWQHQKFNLDYINDLGPSYERNGPYIDFYLSF